MSCDSSLISSTVLSNVALSVSMCLSSCSFVVAVTRDALLMYVELPPVDKMLLMSSYQPYLPPVRRMSLAPSVRSPVGLQPAPEGLRSSPPLL